ncbi:hypothetical protein DYE48_15590 [Halobacillus trueperi]|uniref:Uncharacterized protein n=1 Tax=Halobacillus trueperi TaxID=156205 RepID=A0A3E0J4X9_9BACI|nr:hypothetical protein DYE48_15590 [Halobacillus trueperi]
MREWKQPEWFWWAIGIFSLSEIVFYLLFSSLGNSPKDISTASLIIGLLLYPIFTISILLFLDKSARKDINTLLYLAFPLVINIPFWLVFPDIIRQLTERIF